MLTPQELIKKELEDFELWYSLNLAKALTNVVADPMLSSTAALVKSGARLAWMSRAGLAILDNVKDVQESGNEG